MQIINPNRLKSFRKYHGWSMERLASESGISKSTIQRIEKGGDEGSRREHTLERLARTLQVTEAELADPAPIELRKPKEKRATSQINVRMGSDARNALALVSARYGIKPATILRLAPLLFSMVAEESLASRLHQIRKLEDVSGAPGAIPRSMEQSISEYSRRETASIEARDIFGKMLDDEPLQRWSHTGYADYVGIYNPLALHLKHRTAESCTNDKFSGWDHDTGPYYEVGSEIALALCDGNDELASMLISGDILIHEMPSELSETENLEPRLKWLHTQRDRVIAEQDMPNPFSLTFDLAKITVGKEQK